MPLPCKSAIFSSRVICFRTSSARSSGERLEFIQGWFAFCAMTEPAATQSHGSGQYDDCPSMKLSQLVSLHVSPDIAQPFSELVGIIRRAALPKAY